MTTGRSQQGFSLIEMLVALIVFSVGLLAVAGLQTVSKQANFESLQRTTASQIAYGLLEDMRVNANPIERAVMQEIKRRSRKIRVFPNEEATLRLITAIVIDINEK